MAEGKYIGFIDSDDFIEPDMFEYLYNLLQNDKYDISICGFNDYYEDKETEKVEIQKQEIVLNNIQAIEELITDKNIQSYAWNKLYKMELFKKHNIQYPVGKKMEDVGTTYKLFYYSNNIIVGSERKYNYRRRVDSITGNKDARFYIDWFEIVLERYNFFENIGLHFRSNYEWVIRLGLKMYTIDDIIITQYINENKLNELLKKLLSCKKYKLNKKLKIKTIIWQNCPKAYNKIVREYSKWLKK